MSDLRATEFPSAEWLPWLLQLTDSQFPSGAYAHSGGLEEMVRMGVVRTPEDLRAFLREQITPGLVHFELPWLSRAHAAAAVGNVEMLCSLDRELDAWKLPAETRLASTRMGRRRLALLMRLSDDPILKSFADAQMPGHQLTVCALELRHLPCAAARCAWAYQTFSGFCTASLKLIRIGQEGCQGILRSALAEIVLHLSTPQDPEEAAQRIGWFNPLLEISSMRHAISPERLFLS